MVNTPAGNLPFLDNYGAITRAQVTAHVTALLANDDRSKQNDAQLLACLQNSVNKATISSMANSHALWKVTPTNAAAELDSGILYLYTLLDKLEVKTRPLCSHIMLQLGDTPKIMKVEAKNNIRKFNTIVEVHLKTLRNHRQPIPESDLIPYLFKGYLSCYTK